MFKIENERENHHVACLLTIGFVSILLVSFGTVHNAFADNVTSTITLGGKSEYLGVNPTTNKIYASLVDGNTVSVIDGVTDTVAGTITVENFPHGVGVNPTTNKIYVANQNDDTVSVINGTTDSVIDTISISNPWAVGVNPSTNKIYVAAPQNGVYVIDGTTDSVTKISSMNPNSIGVNPTTNKIYATNALDNTISVINGTTDSVIDTIPVSNPWAIGVNPTTNKIYVANIDNDTISIIDGTTNNVVTTMLVGNHPDSIGVNPTTNKIYVANAYDNTVSVIDSTTNNVVSTMLVESDPHDVGVNPITNRIYVDNFNSNTISIIDGSTTVPSAPQNLTATTISSSQINLSWSAPANNGGALVTGYMIERSTDNGSTWSTMPSNTDTTYTTYTDSGLASGTTYTYQVSAINSIGTGSPSNTASVTTSSISIYAGFLTCCYGDLKTEGGVKNPVPGINQIQFQIYAPNGSLVYNKTEPTSFQDEHGISRSDGKGNYTLITTYDNELIVKKEIPSWINNNSVYFASGELSDGSVSIGGRAYTGILGEQDSVTILDSNNSTTATYTIGTGLQGQLQLEAYATQQACVANRGDPSLCPGPFTNTAFPTSGNYTIILTYPTGDIAGKTMLAYTSKIPSPPTGLTATAQLLKINLSWITPNDNGATPITGYMIERSTDNGNTWSTLVANTASTGTTYSDTHVLSLKTYTYRVSAINDAGLSNPSNTASASIASKPTLP